MPNTLSAKYAGFSSCSKTSSGAFWADLGTRLAITSFYFVAQLFGGYYACESVAGGVAGGVSCTGHFLRLSSLGFRLLIATFLDLFSVTC